MLVTPVLRSWSQSQGCMELHLLVDARTGALMQCSSGSGSDSFGQTNGIKQWQGIEKLHKMKQFITYSVHIFRNINHTESN
jgi:hypothetical protein